MPPEILLLNGIITAIAAVLGVLLAQWWTGRREDRQWQRQRERDREEREEQRNRDHTLWQREDRHRFVTEKRAVYGDLLAAMSEYQDRIVSTLNGKSGLLPERFDTSDPFGSIRSTLGSLSLLAPFDITNIAQSTVADLVSVVGHITGSIPARPADIEVFGEDEVVNAYFRDFQLGCVSLLNAMRDDLAVP